MREKVRRSCDDLLHALGALAAARAAACAIASRALARGRRRRPAALRSASRCSPSSSCRLACTKPIGLLSSCATPATSWPSERIFSLCISCACVSRSSRVRSSTRASSVSFSFAISSNALAFSIAIALWFASVRSSWRSSASDALAGELRARPRSRRAGRRRTGSARAAPRRARRRRRGRRSRVSGSGASSKSTRVSSWRRIQRCLPTGWSIGSVERARLVVPLAAPRRRPQALRLVVEQQHHRALDAHASGHRARQALDDLVEREHRDHRLGDLAHRVAVAGRGRGRRRGRRAPAGGRAAG